MPFNDSILLVDRKWNQMGKQPLKGMPYSDQRSNEALKDTSHVQTSPETNSLKSTDLSEG
jgi:hypothetical protein